MLGQSRMIAYIDIMAGKKGANLKYGEPTRNVCASIPMSLDGVIRRIIGDYGSYSAALVSLLRTGLECGAAGRPSAPFVDEGGIQGGQEAPSDSRPLLAPSGPFRLVRRIDGNDIDLPNSLRSTLAEAERLRDQERVKTSVEWEIRGVKHA